MKFALKFFFTFFSSFVIKFYCIIQVVKFFLDCIDCIEEPEFVVSNNRYILSQLKISSLFDIKKINDKNYYLIFH